MSKRPEYAPEGLCTKLFHGDSAGGEFALGGILLLAVFDRIDVLGGTNEEKIETGITSYVVAHRFDSHEVAAGHQVKDIPQLLEIVLGCVSART